MRTSILALAQGTAWTEWVPLAGSWRGTILPTDPGLYRIRSIAHGETRLAYIGQSGNLKERIGALKNVYSTEMPYRAPHTAGQLLILSQKSFQFCWKPQKEYTDSICYWFIALGAEKIIAVTSCGVDDGRRSAYKNALIFLLCASRSIAWIPVSRV